MFRNFAGRALAQGIMARARSAVLIGTFASLGALSLGQTASAQALSAACNGSIWTLDSSHSFPAKTGDVYTNVQDDSMANLEVRNSLGASVTNVQIRHNETYTVPSNANGGSVLATKVNTLAGTPRLSCGAAAAATTPATAAQTSVTVQAKVTQAAINTVVAGRFGGPGIAANSNGLTVSTRGLDGAIGDFGEPELNAWVGIEGRRFSGTTTGDSRNISFGIDRLVNPDLVVGGYVSYNDQTAIAGGAKTITKSPILGAYAGYKLKNGLFVSGFFGYGRPDYTIGTTRFTATRKMLGLSMSGQFVAGGVRLTPLASLLTTREDMPAAGSLAADRLDNTQASLSLRAEPLARLANGMLPYISLGAEYHRQGSNLVAYSTIFKPRLGLGFDWQLPAGNLRFDLDYGSLSRTSNDLGASLVYDFKF